MKIGLIGLPNSGKTTIFNALTNSEAEVRTYAAEKAEPNRAVVDVIDERIDYLSQMYKPKKTVYASVEFIDFQGSVQGPPKDWSLSGHATALMKNTDALALVVRNFRDHLGEVPNPLADILRVEEEFLFSDLLICEGRLERIASGYSRGKKTEALQAEEKVLGKVLQQLHGERPLRDLQLNQEEEKIIRGFQFFTGKPFMVILNSDEMNFGHHRDLLEEIGRNHKVIEFAGKFEMELSRLNDEQEVELFMEDMGIKESARDRLTRMAYETLKYISFFTVGPDEVHAWNIILGETALAAAAAIHTDLARGFIRAECFSYEDTIEYGSEKVIREKGHFRLEGKNYIIRDG
ncbi:MAG: DUF933 domain-containing protein, partial [Pseudomonadota bacterium]